MCAVEERSTRTGGGDGLLGVIKIRDELCTGALTAAPIRRPRNFWETHVGEKKQKGQCPCFDAP